MDKKDLKIIIGLGNPENKYKNTRHNVGKLFLDYLNQTENSWQTLKKSPFEFSEKNNLILSKSLVFMNESGKAVKNLIDYFKIKKNNLLIVQDDSDLIFEKVRLTKARSSSGGHHGIESIESLLGKNKFQRLKIGIRPPSLANWRAPEGQASRLKAEEFVLKKFTNEELEILKNKVFPEAEKLLESWLNEPK